jgi:penicillin-binding protein 2
MSVKQRKFSRYDPGKYRRKFRVIVWIIMISVTLLLSRIWYLQIIKGNELRSRSENNRIRVHEVKALRGVIRDIHGNVIVENQPSFDISIVPGSVKNVADVVKMLELIHENHGMKFKRDISASERNRPFIPLKLAKNVSWEELALVETNALDLPGVVVDVVPVREYIGGEMTAHLLGHVGEVSPDDLKGEGADVYKPGDRVGKSGIEKYLDEYLRGKNGGEYIEVNATGRRVKSLKRVEPVPGHDVTLTIDSELQQVAWDAMKNKVGSVVAMDPRDGSIRVMISAPAFDPNLFNTGISREEWQALAGNPLRPMENKAISCQYPPGSTFKIITAAAGLAEGVITPETTFNCSGAFHLGNRDFRCWEKKGHGRMNLHKAIVQSCDIYFYNVGKLVGVDKLAEYSRRFGLGASTGIPLLGEKNGLIPTSEWKLKNTGEPWQGGETMSIAIGQSYLLVTPLQLLSAYCALANGGTLYVPRIVERVESPDRRVLKHFEPEIRAMVSLSQDYMELIRSGLWGVCNEAGGTGWALRRPEQDVGGKTGTAQVVGQTSRWRGVKSENIPRRWRDHALFVCFAPVQNPEIAVVVVLEHGGHGGSAAAPVARKVVDAYFQNKAAEQKKIPEARESEV